MFHIILHEPDIPANTGNILRLAHNTNCTVGLIEPLGFTLNDKQLKRAGLDYINPKIISQYNDFNHFINSIKANTMPRIFFATTKTSRAYTTFNYQAGDYFIFGSETKGIPTDILEANATQCITIPMNADSRSLNLANSVAIIIYEALRQHNFTTFYQPINQ